MKGITNTDSIIELGAERDAKIRVKVGEHVVKGGVAKQEEAEEAGHDVNDWAEQQGCSNHRLYQRRIFQLILNTVHYTTPQYLTN